VIYSILYLSFVAYPIVFSDYRGWEPKYVGLSYTGIGIGTMLAIFLEPVYRKIINSHKRNPVTGRPEPESMVSIICIASISVPIGEMIFAWTCVPVRIHYVFPMLGGIFFGAGNCVIFILSQSYQAQSYGIYAASALAGSTVSRSILGGVLPLAGRAMYDSLGPNYAGTLLACLEIVLIPIPFVFYKYGHKIRAKSTLIRQMQEDQDRLQAKLARNKLLVQKQGSESKRTSEKMLEV
jgi:hypothetical protein